MKCQILFSGENKKSITNLSSANIAQRMVKVNESYNNIYKKKKQVEQTHSPRYDAYIYFFGVRFLTTIILLSAKK